MRILIDGYNLLHVSGILRRGFGRGTLERARLALLNRISNGLSSQDRQETTVVFDAKDAPRDLPQEQQIAGLQVRFARDFEEADDLLEYLIRTHSAPRQLLVVSSDRRVQRAAKRRRAQCEDSERWLARLKSAKVNRPLADEMPEPPSDELAGDQVEAWMEEFGYGHQYDPERSPLATELSDPLPPTPSATTPTATPPSSEHDAKEEHPAAKTAAKTKPTGEAPITSSLPPKRPSRRDERSGKPPVLDDHVEDQPFPQEYLDELRDLEDQF